MDNLLYGLWFLDWPVLSKTWARNVKIRVPAQNSRRTRWRSVTEPSDRTWNRRIKTLSYRPKLLYILLWLATYLLAVSPVDSVHAVDGRESEPFRSRSAIFTLLLMTGLSVIGWKFRSKRCSAVNFRNDVRNRMRVSCCLTWSALFENCFVLSYMKCIVKENKKWRLFHWKIQISKE